MNLVNAFSRVNADIGEEISKGFQEKMIPSWLSFVTQFLALVVLLIVVFVFAYKPVKKMLSKRADYIEQNIHEAEEKNANAEVNQKQAEEMVLASKKEAAQIISNANQQIEMNRQEMIDETRQEIEKMKLQAEEDIERSRQEALDDIHHEMVEVALSASAEILKREVNNKDNERLAEDFVNNLK